MHPPAWALANSTRLDFDEFGVAFASAWSQLKSRFLKLECWQRYWEAEGNRSQTAYDRGDIDTARELLRAEAEVDRPLYQDIRTRGIEYARVRLVQEPLTPYLKYELLSYRIRADLGENIEVVRRDDDARLPSEGHFDFLLFDRTTALIHDYGSAEVGRQTGGWLTRDSNVIARLEQTVADLRQQAVPLNEYLART
ncbi:DUF6879 family protein [Actinoplanes siamensis]|uniref:DUF6879 domain-containing protein n=1 Tax=Actinoplanes siamensis TaxID=1223317 RepID=A0A919N6F6_9ACTN|nr:DUF6879 family protein [Actinoplanes siamensis]GIF05323.1 hypothetical protein Asi03nite_28610 [Actinoplanes siamensis]